MGAAALLEHAVRKPQVLVAGDASVAALVQQRCNRQGVNDRPGQPDYPVLAGVVQHRVVAVDIVEDGLPDGAQERMPGSGNDVPLLELATADALELPVLAPALILRSSHGPAGQQEDV